MGDYIVTYFSDFTDLWEVHFEKDTKRQRYKTLEEAGKVRDQLKKHPNLYRTPTIAKLL